MRFIKQALVAFLVALGFGVALAIMLPTIGSTQTDRSRPPWVDGRGKIDQQKLPSVFPVFGSDGKQVVDCFGRPVMVRSAALLGGDLSLQDVDPASLVEVRNEAPMDTDSKGQLDTVIIYVPSLDTHLLPVECR